MRSVMLSLHSLAQSSLIATVGFEPFVYCARDLGGGTWSLWVVPTKADRPQHYKPRCEDNILLMHDGDLARFLPQPEEGQVCKRSSI